MFITITKSHVCAMVYVHVCACAVSGLYEISGFVGLVLQKVTIVYVPFLAFGPLGLV